MERRTMQWTDGMDGWMERKTEEWTDGTGWMEWKGERMNGRMESMFDSGMDGCLGEKRIDFGGLLLGAGRTNKKKQKLEKVRKQLANVSKNIKQVKTNNYKVSLHL